jgi:hypothetical protein
MATAGFAGPSSGLYYKHSGRFSASGSIAALFISAAVGIPMGWLYGWVDYGDPLLYIRFIVPLFYGALVGAAAESVLERFKCRNVIVAGIVALLATASSYYFSWAVWLHAFVGLRTRQFLIPANLWAAVRAVNLHRGAWEIGGTTIPAFWLWVTWAAEALTVLFAGTACTVATLKEATFCETCNRWTTEKDQVCLAAAGVAPPEWNTDRIKQFKKAVKADGEAMKERMEEKDFSYLQHLGAVPEDGAAWYRLDVHRCPDCGMTQTLRVTQFCRKFERPDPAKDKTDSDELFCQLLLTPAEAEQITNLGQKMPPKLPKLAQDWGKKADAGTEKASAAGVK